MCAHPALTADVTQPRASQRARSLTVRNAYSTMPAVLRFLTAGESHGPALTVIVEGLPAGVPVDRAAIDADLRRRQGGYGRGGRMKIETDTVEVLSGVRHGRRWAARSRCSSATGPRELEGRDVAGPAARRRRTTRRALKHPRPGHADLAGALKYLTDDLRNVLERASARETTRARGRGRAGQGAPARAAGVEVRSHVLRIGEAALPAGAPLAWDGLGGGRGEPGALRGRATPRTAMIAEIDARQEGRRHRGRRLRGRGARRAAGPRAPSRSGTAGSTAASPRP